MKFEYHHQRAQTKPQEICGRIFHFYRLWVNNFPFRVSVVLYRICDVCNKFFYSSFSTWTVLYVFSDRIAYITYTCGSISIVMTVKVFFLPSEFKVVWIPFPLRSCVKYLYRWNLSYCIINQYILAHCRSFHPITCFNTSKKKKHFKIKNLQVICYLLCSLKNWYLIEWRKPPDNVSYCTCTMYICMNVVWFFLCLSCVTLNDCCGIVRSWVVMYYIKFLFCHKRILSSVLEIFNAINPNRKKERKEIKQQLQKKQIHRQTNEQASESKSSFAIVDKRTQLFRWKAEILSKEKCKRVLHYCCSTQTCNNSI